MVVWQHSPKHRDFSLFDSYEEAAKYHAELSAAFAILPELFFLGLLSVKLIEAKGRGRDLWVQRAGKQSKTLNRHARRVAEAFVFAWYRLLRPFRLLWEIPAIGEAPAKGRGIPQVRGKP